MYTIEEHEVKIFEVLPRIAHFIKLLVTIRRLTRKSLKKE